MVAFSLLSHTSEVSTDVIGSGKRRLSIAAEQKQRVSSGELRFHSKCTNTDRSVTLSYGTSDSHVLHEKLNK